MFKTEDDKEFLYDITKCNLLGEITKDTSLGRWSVGYYQANGYYHVAYTEGNTTPNEVHYHISNKEKALKLYNDLAGKYSYISRRIRESVGVRAGIPNEELKKLYLQFSVEYSRGKSQVEREQKALEAKQLSDLSQATEARKTNSYVDYVLFYSKRIVPSARTRTDYVWLSEKGEVLFEGRAGFENVIYLISGKIHVIKKFYDEIKALISSYCEKNEGHNLYDPCRKNVEISYYSRLESGYIEKQVCIDNLTYQDILDMYDNAKRNGDFPNEQEKQNIRKKIDSYLDYMDKSHGGY